MAPTPSPRPGKEHATPSSKTPHSKHRLHFPGGKTPNAAVPSPLPSVRENSVPTEHPVEVIGRIRDYPERKETPPPSALEIAEDGRSVRVRTDIGYRDFTLDGVSVSADEDLEEFYGRFVEERVRGVRVGAKCTIMMYGPTGAGKSHTMFGCPRQPGIVYRALRDILGEGGEENGAGAGNGGFGIGLFVQVAVLEIYNEEIYDLLSGYTGGGANGSLPKGTAPKVRLEIMGKKAKNATYISGNEAGKISKEVAKVEKRRIVKSTLCNDRSSRSHCLIILDVPTVGGRLMLVDMAGSENIEQAGQNGFEAKMQTAKINQGNTALKRVVESIANGDSHVPFRDSKLTMLLQDSFEDDKSKILMILCASPDPAEMHRTLSTLEYGAKAKCIVRAAHMPTPCKTNSEESSVVLSSRIVAMNQFIFKLQMENKVKEREREEAQRELSRKEEEVGELRAKLRLAEASAVKEEAEIESKVDERTRLLRVELEKMERRMQQQEQELEALRQRLVEMVEGGEKKGGIVDNEKLDEAALQDIGARFANRLSSALCGGADHDAAGMEKSMELDLGDSVVIHDVKEVRDEGGNARRAPPNLATNSSSCGGGGGLVVAEEGGGDALMSRFPDKVFLSTVFEGEEGEEELDGGEQNDEEEEEVEKEVIEENNDRYSSARDLSFDGDHARDMDGTADDAAISARRTRIQNIFRLCGNHRELAHQVRVPTPTKRRPCADENPPLPPPLCQSVVDPKADLDLLPVAGLHLADEQRSTETTRSQKYQAFSDKENSRPVGDDEKGAAAERGLDDIYVKWEASKDVSGDLKKLQVLKNSTLADLRKSIETHLGEQNNLNCNKQDFTFLLLGDPTGAPVAKEKEAMTQVGRLPICNNQLGGHLACLRPSKTAANQQPPPGRQVLLPFGQLENKLLVAAVNSPSKTSRQVEGAPPSMGENMGVLAAGFRV